MNGWLEIEERIVDLRNSSEVKAIAAFLAGFDLGFDTDVEYTVAFYSHDELVATGSFAGETPPGSASRYEAVVRHADIGP